MTWESWFKVGLSGIPVLFTILGPGLYWGDNILPALAPSIGFWGVVIAFYLYTHIYIPGKRSPFFLAVSTACLWMVSSITAHNLGRFVGSSNYHGTLSVLGDKDFWYSYFMSAFSALLALSQFLKHEPGILAQSRADSAP
jgi:hypothetical protein